MSAATWVPSTLSIASVVVPLFSPNLKVTPVACWLSPAEPRFTLAKAMIVGSSSTAEEPPERDDGENTKTGCTENPWVGNSSFSTAMLASSRAGRPPNPIGRSRPDSLGHLASDVEHHLCGRAGGPQLWALAADQQRRNHPRHSHLGGRVWYSHHLPRK